VHHREDDDFEQAGDLYRLISPAEKDRLIANIAGSIPKVSREHILERTIGNFRRLIPIMARVRKRRCENYAPRARPEGNEQPISFRHTAFDKRAVAPV